MTKIYKKQNDKLGLVKTEFQLHCSQNSESCSGGIIDYAECKLKKCIEQTTNNKQKLVLIEVLKAYISGDVAVAWNDSQPIWLYITKEKT
jgi:hypothetical protein